MRSRPFRSRAAWLVAWGLTVSASGTTAPSAHSTAVQGLTAAQNAEARKLKNPVRVDAAGLAAGKKMYDTHCASCHGTTGLGDGKMGIALTPKPSNLVDAEWDYGATDPHLFIAIRDGVPQTAMRAYGARLTSTEIWQIVNYVRSLNPSPHPSRRR